MTRPALLGAGVAAALLFDIFTTIVPHLTDLERGARWRDGDFPGAFPGSWSLFQLDAFSWTPVVAVWVIAAGLLLAGRHARASAAVCWVVKCSFLWAHPMAHDRGDVVGAIALFHVMTWNRWTPRLVALQVAVFYCASALFKLLDPAWCDGTALARTLADPLVARAWVAGTAWPAAATAAATWMVLAWELMFPVLVSVRATRRGAWMCGVAFHVAIFVLLDLGAFAPYMLALYLPLLAE